MPSKEYGVKALGVSRLPTSKLRPNPHNPRMLFDLEDLTVLQESIERVGILVPLTVYKDSKAGDYVILDGQRRWMCARKLELSHIPVNEVREPTLVQNIVTMFQIHKLRLDWELMPTALKVEVLIDETGDRNNRRLASLTGLDEAVIVRCKKLLSYSPKYRDMMLDADPAKRIKADFFIELYVVITDRNVRSFSWFRKDRFVDRMLQKFSLGAIKSVTDFRIVKQHITNAITAGQTTIISQLLREFADDLALTVNHLDIEAATVDAEARKIERVIDQLVAQLNALDVNEVYGELDMWDKLESLVELIQEKLRAVDRRERPARRRRD
jgi:ParB/RepB/Spo0J family partition protein